MGGLLCRESGWIFGRPDRGVLPRKVDRRRSYVGAGVQTRNGWPRAVSVPPGRGPKRLRLALPSPGDGAEQRGQGAGQGRGRADDRRVPLEADPGARGPARPGGGGDASARARLRADGSTGDRRGGSGAAAASW